MFLVENDPRVDLQKFKMAENYDWLEYEDRHERDHNWDSGWTGYTDYTLYKGDTYTISII
jgi:hypothetical protein